MSRRLYDNLNNFYPVSKTLRFSLIPVGKTKEHLELDHIFDMDMEKEKKAEIVKKLMDEYHKDYIIQQLDGFYLSNLDDFYNLYIKKNRSKGEEEQLKKLQSNLGKQIHNQLTNSKKFPYLFHKKMITELLKNYLEEQDRQEELVVLSHFHKFTSYFRKYNTSRMNVYADIDNSASFSYRTIVENLDQFIKNKLIFDKFINTIKYNGALDGLLSALNINTIYDCFNIDYFNHILTQHGIVVYNTLISGFTNEEGKQFKGLNNLIHEYNNSVSKKEEFPKLTKLANQIMYIPETMSFVLDAFKSPKEVLDAIATQHKLICDYCFDGEEEIITSLLSRIQEFDLDKIFIHSKKLVYLSKVIYGNPQYLNTILKAKNPKQRKGPKFYTLQDLVSAANSYEKNMGDQILDYFCILKNNQQKNIIKILSNSYSKLEPIFNKNHKNTYEFLKDNVVISNIKEYMDNVKEYSAFVLSFIPENLHLDLDMRFYSALLGVREILECVTPLYNKVRNFMTQKPYSNKKIKLNFDNPFLLAGWDLNREKDNKSILFEKEGIYYLGIAKKGIKYNFADIICKENEPCYRKMIYKLLPGPNKLLPKVFFSEKWKGPLGVTDEFYNKYKAGMHLKGNHNFSLPFCHELIDFYKNSIANYPEWNQFNFIFKDTIDYRDIGEFYRDVEVQGYKIRFKDIPAFYVDTLVEQNKMYLFKIYNKDFSAKTKGLPNLHTMYWKALFDEKNIENPIYKLNGEAEIFYRKASVAKTISHPKGLSIQNKNPLGNNKEVVLDIDLYKDKRYMDDKLMLHVSITMNFNSLKKGNINEDVNTFIKANDDFHVMGIHRGENHLLYLCVINMRGEIIHQESLNEIRNSQNFYVKNKEGKLSTYSGEDSKYNYFYLLLNKEKERDDASKSWRATRSIKDLNEGYISQIVHRIATLMVKYNAIVVLEELDDAFINPKIKVKTHMYQQFYKQFIEKLNYLVIKDHAFKQVDTIDKKHVVDTNILTSNPGSLLAACQLTNKFESLQKLWTQSGVVFFVPSNYTKTLDPVTGFINHFHTQYENMAKAKEFFLKFADIYYNEKQQFYEFIVDDYSKFATNPVGIKQDWVLCSYSTRIEYTKDAKNNTWIAREVDLTKEFKNLFFTYNIDEKNLKESILNNTEIDFFKSLMHLMKLLLQLCNFPKDGNDYIVSPVKDRNGNIFDSREGNVTMPVNVVSNGAYNSARKGLMAIRQIKNTPDGQLKKIKFDFSNQSYLNFIQQNHWYL